jgi:hypothetical protein
VSLPARTFTTPPTTTTRHFSRSPPAPGPEKR